MTDRRLSDWRRAGAPEFYASETQLKKLKRQELARVVRTEQANYRTKPNNVPGAHRPYYRSPRPGSFWEADVMSANLYKTGPHKFVYVFIETFTGEAPSILGIESNRLFYRIYFRAFVDSTHGTQRVLGGEKSSCSRGNSRLRTSGNFTV